MAVEPGEPLSKREIDVLNCVSDGASNKEVAGLLFISENTVKVHLRNIYTKLEVSSRTEAVKVAIQRREIESHLAAQEEEAAQEAAQEAVAQEAAVQETAVQDTVDRSEEESDSEEKPPLLPAPAKWTTILVIIIVLLIMVVIGLFLMQQRREEMAVGTTAVETATVDTTAVDTTAVETAAATAVPYADIPIGDTAWMHTRPLPHAKAQMAVAAVGLNLYAIGGIEGTHVNGNVQQFNSSNKTWDRMADKPTAVTHVTAATLFGEIYVPGGQLEGGEITAVVEAYSPVNDAWRPVASLPEPLAGGLTLSDGGYLYYVGGWNGMDYVNTIYLYDAAADSWRPLPPMQIARAYSAGEQMMGKLFIAGGFNGDEALTTCEIFDTVEQVWTFCADLLLPRSDGGGTAVLNKLYIIGGEVVAGSDPAFAEQYDPDSDTWQIVNIPAETKSLAGLRYNGVTHIETTIYTIGGMNEEHLITDTLTYTPIVYRTYIPAASSGGE